MAKRKAARKRPTDAAKDWQRQADAAVKFLERLKSTPSIHGVNWTRKMVAHYQSQYLAFRATAPRSCKKQAKLLDERVNIVVHAVLKKQ